MTTPDPYLMPRVDDMLTKIGNAKFLTKMDLNKGFHQIPLREEDQCKTAFCTPWGKWQYTVMAFGLCNAPAIFQHLMHIILADISSFANAYMDDIVIFSNNWDKHLIHIDIVLNRFQQHGLTMKQGKCQWGSTNIEFLGHVAGDGHISVPDCRVQAIRDYKKPVNQTDLRLFLGITRYYRRFIKDYAQHSIHLTNTTRKSAPVELYGQMRCTMSFYIIAMFLLILVL